MNDVGERMVRHPMIPLRIAEELDHAWLTVRWVPVPDAWVRFFRVDHLARHAHEEFFLLYVRALFCRPIRMFAAVRL